MEVGDWAVFVPLSPDRATCSGAASLAAESANGGLLSEGLTTTLRLDATNPVYALCIARPPFDGGSPRDADFSYHPHVKQAPEESGEGSIAVVALLAAFACCCCCWLLRLLLIKRKRKWLIDKGTITGPNAHEVDVGKSRPRRTRLLKPSTASKATMTDETGPPLDDFLATAPAAALATGPADASADAPADAPADPPVDIDDVIFGMSSAVVEDDGLAFDVDEDDDRHLVRHLTKRPSIGGGRRRKSEELEGKLTMRPTRDKPPSARPHLGPPHTMPPHAILPPFNEEAMRPVRNLTRRTPADANLEA
ncbi:MAG: hypothetical protein SGPRY_013436 [Prymnesium sp.]